MIPMEPTFAEIKDFLLYHYYLIAMKDIAHGRSTTESMAKVVSEIATSKAIIEKADYQLFKQGLISNDYGDPALISVREITGEGLDHVESETKRLGTFLHNLADDAPFLEEQLLAELETPLHSLEDDTPEHLSVHVADGNKSDFPQTQENPTNEQSDGMLAEGATLQATATTSPPPSTKGPQNSVPLDAVPIDSLDSVPAADRYVSVKDNQPEFDGIKRNLSIIRKEIAADHNKRDLPIENTDAAIAEIDAFETLIESNWVSRPAAKNFLETLQYFEAVLVSSSKALGAVLAIAASLKIIFGLM